MPCAGCGSPAVKRSDCVCGGIVLKKRTVKVLIPAALLTGVFIVCIAYLVNYSQKSISTMASMPSTIVIDPGHGGMDGGAEGAGGVIEKDINLDISLKLRTILQANGFQVVMTRDSDVSIHDEGKNKIKSQKTSDMHNRLKIIQKAENPIFLSIHQNQFPEKKYSGAQIFFSPNNPSSELLADRMQNAFATNLQPENKRQIKRSGKELFLLYKTDVPAVLIECGFISNPDEAAQLATEEYRGKVAFTIFCGLADYLSQEQNI